MSARIRAWLLLSLAAHAEAAHAQEEKHKACAGNGFKMVGDKCEYVGAEDESVGGMFGSVHSWLQPFLPAPYFMDKQDSHGAKPVQMRNTVHAEAYGLSPDLNPSEPILDWLGAHRGGVSALIPDAFLGMMGAPLGVMMSVPPGEPRDGTPNMSADQILQMSKDLAPPEIAYRRHPDKSEHTQGDAPE